MKKRLVVTASLMAKSMIGTYTRGDGAVVNSHDSGKTAAAPKVNSPHMAFHSLEAGHHAAASTAAMKDEYPSGEKLHDRAASAHEAAFNAHKAGQSDAHDLSAKATAASAKADDAFDRKKKATPPAAGAGGAAPKKDIGAMKASLKEARAKYQSLKHDNPASAEHWGDKVDSLMDEISNHPDY